MEIYEDKDRNVRIKARHIEIGDGVSFGRDIDVDVNGSFSIGDRSRLGNDVVIRGNNISFGKDMYHSIELRVGGGGIYHPNANLTIGDRCTIHNNFINICEEVVIGNDVGLSGEVQIITHGYWLSVLEGYPARFAGVTIHDGVIVGVRSIILMGATIGKNAVIGANSVVTKDVEENCIYGGNPARLIRRVEPPSQEDKPKILANIISEYRKIAEYHGIAPEIVVDYPHVRVNGCEFDVEKLVFEGEEDEETDDFRDYVRKWGLRFFSNRPFRSVWPPVDRE